MVAAAVSMNSSGLLLLQYIANTMIFTVFMHTKSNEISPILPLTAVNIVSCVDDAAAAAAIARQWNYMATRIAYLLLKNTAQKWILAVPSIYVRECNDICNVFVYKYK